MSNNIIHYYLQIIATSSLLTWLTVRVIAPLDRRLLLATKGYLSLTGSSTILLITTGAKSGKPRYSSLPGLINANDFVLLASKGGAQSHPYWYHNIVANPEVDVLTKGCRSTYIATVAEDSTRLEMWEWLLDQWPGFLAYEKKALPRVLPIIVLTKN